MRDPGGLGCLPLTGALVQKRLSPLKPITGELVGRASLVFVTDARDTFPLVAPPNAPQSRPVLAEKLSKPLHLNIDFRSEQDRHSEADLLLVVLRARVDDARRVEEGQPPVLAIRSHCRTEQQGIVGAKRRGLVGGREPGLQNHGVPHE